MKSISVVLAVYGKSDFLKEQIDSIRRGNRIPDEIVLYIDKHPTNNFSDTELSQLANGLNIKIFRADNNLGPAESFRRGIIQSSGDILCLCDQDDVWSESKLSVIANCHKYSDATVHQGVIIGTSDLYNKNELLYKRDPAKRSFFRLLKQNNVFGCTMSIKGELAREIASKTKFYPMHDWILILVLKLYSLKLYFIEEPLFYYRRHSENLTQLKSQNSLLVQIKFRLTVCVNLIRYVF
jgi:glycosyltransferase involved in cell wall biosynthesis